MTIARFQKSRVLLFSMIAVAVTIRVWAADCNQNGVDDREDLLGGVSRDCNRNSIPDECDLEVFVRGNSNDDGTLDIADPVFTLAHLFLGGTPPPCSDAADANDDGAVDISDAVYTLDFLFRGGPEPPPPGPRVPGADATPLDPLLCRTPPAPSCAAVAVSTLPGVRFDTSATPCTITLDEAAAGVELPYTVVIDGEIAADFDPRTWGGCHSFNEGGLSVSERIYGNGQLYCLCDVGLCPGGPRTDDLKPGRFEDSFRWNGRNWYGPSDFGAGFGPPFPPGRYRFEVMASGVFRDADGVETVFTVRGESEFDLVP